MEAEIGNFCNIFFCLVSCFLCKNYLWSWAFPAFAIFSLLAQKLNQQPVVAYDMENWEEAIDNTGPQNSLKVSVYLIHWKICLFADSTFKTIFSHNASIWGTLACLPRMIRHKLEKCLLTPPLWVAMLMAQNWNKNIFLGGKTMDIPGKRLKTLLCMVLRVFK